MSRASCRRAAAIAVAAAMPLLSARAAAAQPRFEVGGSVTWTGGFEAGGGDAMLTRPGSTTPLTLFETRSRVEAAPGVAVRAAVFVTPHVAVEGLGEFSRPVLRTRFAGDFENATGTAATNTLSSYRFGASLRYHFGNGRVSPFVMAGAGRLRQLDEHEIALVTGTELHAGGGVRVRAGRRAAIRADLVASSRDRSLSFEATRHVLPVASFGVSYVF